MSGKTEKIYVSFSGGADSMALLLTALQTYPAVQAVHFEHGFRGEDSLRDAAFCRAFCEARAVPFHLIPLQVPANKLPGESDETAARRLRLAAWKKLLAEESNAVVLTGHHADDAVETLFMRLCRGSNATGLAGLRQEKIVEGIRFRRPLLHLTRQEITAFLHEQGITEWCEDATNNEDAYTRNFFRNRILPQICEKLPYASGGFRRTLCNLEDDADFLEQTAQKEFLKCKAGRLDDWCALHPALRVRVLRLFLKGIAPDHKLMERFTELLYSKRDPEPRYLQTGSDSYIVFRGDFLSLERKPIPQTEFFWNWKDAPRITFGEYTLELETVDAVNTDNDRNECFFDADTLPRRLLVSSWREGDTICAFDGHIKNLKKLFCDLHLNGSERKKIPVLRTENGDILFVPGVRAAALYTVTAETRHILRIRSI